MNIKILLLIRVVIITFLFIPKDLFAQQILPHPAIEEMNSRHLNEFVRDVNFEKRKSDFFDRANSSKKEPANTLTYSVVLKDKKKYWSRLYTDSIFNAKSNALRQVAIEKGYDTIIINIYYKRDYWFQKYVVRDIKQ